MTRYFSIGRSAVLAGLAVATIGVFSGGCDQPDKSKHVAVDAQNSAPAQVQARQTSLDSSWVEVDAAPNSVRFAFPKIVEPRRSKQIFDRITVGQVSWRASVPENDADYSVRLLDFPRDLDALNNTRDFFEWQQARLDQEIKGEFEAAEYRLEEEPPSVDLRFTVDRGGKKGVVFARFVLAGNRLYELMVNTSRDSAAPVAPFMQSLVIEKAKGDTMAPAGCGCRFAMPPSTEPRTTKFELPDGTAVEAQTYLHNSTDRPIAYSVSFATVPDGLLLDFAPRKVLKHLAQNIADRVDGEVLDTAEIKNAGRNGLEAAIVHTVAGKRKGLIRAQIFVGGADIHVVEVAMLDPRFAESERVQNFLDSLEFGRN